MRRRSVAPTMAESLTEDLFSMKEPWRSRFLALITYRVLGGSSQQQPPTREEVVTWLGDWYLHQEVARLLNAWPRG